MQNDVVNTFCEIRVEGVGNQAIDGDAALLFVLVSLLLVCDLPTNQQF